MSAETCTIHFEGRVQKVGFRATSESILSNYPITGYVMNLRDGRVRLVAQGERAVVSSAIQSLRTHFARNITQATEVWGPVTETFRDFTIREDGL
jgi:acylphosphatase